MWSYRGLILSRPRQVRPPGCKLVVPPSHGSDLEYMSTRYRSHSTCVQADAVVRYVSTQCVEPSNSQTASGGLAPFGSSRSSSSKKRAVRLWDEWRGRTAVPES